MLYTIGEMAKLLDVPTSTLRFYDKEGMLPFIERSSGGMRMFKNSDYEFLQIIGCLKKSGMSLKDIREFIYMVMQGDETIEARRQLFVKRKDEVEKQIHELQSILDTLNYKCWYYGTAKEEGTTALIEDISLEDVPEEFQAVRRKLKGV